MRRSIVAVVGFGVVIGFAAPAEADQTLFRARVNIGADGNGVAAGQFNGPTQDREVFLVVVNGCTGEVGCAGADQVNVDLNGESVFEIDDGQEGEQRVRVPGVAGANEIIVTAFGNPGTQVNVRVVAVRPIFPHGVSILPHAEYSPLRETFVRVHNAGTAPAKARLVFGPDEGQISGAFEIAPFATSTFDLRTIASALPFTWTSGPVHVTWETQGQPLISAVAVELHRVRGAGGVLELIDVETVPLDDVVLR